MLSPGSRAYVRAIVAAQMLAQIGAFALPALLPTYMLRWHLTATDAGWLVGVFFAAYVAAVPLLLAMTDRMPVRRIYLLGTGLTTFSHLGFAFRQYFLPAPTSNPCISLKTCTRVARAARLIGDG